MHYSSYTTPKRLNDYNPQLEVLQKEGVEKSSIKSIWHLDTFVEDGVTTYTEEEGGPVFIKTEILSEFAQQAVKKPMYIDHIDEQPDESDKKIVGYVIDSGVLDGKVWVHFVITDQEAHDLLENGWQTSSAWKAIETDRTGGTHNATPYDEMPIHIKVEHLAVVDKGRHESAKLTRINRANKNIDNSKNNSNMNSSNTNNDLFSNADMASAELFKDKQEEQGFFEKLSQLMSFNRLNSSDDTNKKDNEKEYITKSECEKLIEEKIKKIKHIDKKENEDPEEKDNECGKDKKENEDPEEKEKKENEDPEEKEKKENEDPEEKENSRKNSKGSGQSTKDTIIKGLSSDRALYQNSSSSKYGYHGFSFDSKIIC